MATLSEFRRRLISFQKLIELNRWRKIGSSNNYSVFPPSFVRPIFKKDEQNSLETSGEVTKLTHVPFRPAQTEDTCSEFHDALVRKFINYFLKDGRKALARNVVEKTFETIKRTQLAHYNSCKDGTRENIELDPKVILQRAVSNSKPLLELVPIKRGGITYQVPAAITDKRSQFLAFKWLLNAGNEKKGCVRFPDKMAKELIDAAHNKGRVVKRKQDLHKQCEANRAYAHYRWM